MGNASRFEIASFLEPIYCFEGPFSLRDMRSTPIFHPIAISFDSSIFGASNEKQGPISVFVTPFRGEKRKITRSLREQRKKFCAASEANFEVARK